MPAHDVDLLDLALADVGDHEVAVRREREPPRVAQAVGVDLAARAAAAHERVADGTRVRAAAVGARVDADDLAEQRAEVLAVAARAVLVAAAAAVAEARRRAARRARTAPGRRCGWTPDAAPRARSRAEPRRRAVGARAAVLDDPDVAVVRRVVDVEQPARARSRARTRATAGRARRPPRCGRRRPGTAATSVLPLRTILTRAALLDHEQAAAVAGRRGHVDRARRTCRCACRRRPGRAAVGRGRRRGRRGRRRASRRRACARSRGRRRRHSRGRGPPPPL